MRAWLIELVNNIEGWLRGHGWGEPKYEPGTKIIAGVKQPDGSTKELELKPSAGEGWR